jgi:anti-anti-sigma factor
MSSYGIELTDAGDGREVHARLSGELDLLGARELELRLAEVAPDDVRLVIDLNGVSFLDSAALHVLFKLARGRAPDRLAFVVDPGARVAGTLEIVGLGRVAPVGPSPDALERESDER